MLYKKENRGMVGKIMKADGLRQVDEFFEVGIELYLDVLKDCGG